MLQEFPVANWLNAMPQSSKTAVSQLNGVGAESELPLTRESYLTTWHPAVSHGFGEYNTT